MANGGNFNQEQWQRLEKPLLEIDPVINEFAALHGLEVTRNLKDWPERSMAWYAEDVRCLIQLYLASEEGPTFNLWFCASQDRGRERYWKTESPVQNEPILHFASRLPSLLAEGREKLLAWSNNPSVMKYATDMG